MKFKRIYIEITNCCNLNCSFCQKDKRPKKSISIDEFRHIINEIKDYTNMVYFHIKGEPFLNSNIIEFIKMCEENNIAVKITTNGTLLKNYYLDLVKCNNIKQINISLHSEHNNKNYNMEIFNIVDALSLNTTVVYRIWNLEKMKLDEKTSKIIEDIKAYYKLEYDFLSKKNIKLKENIYLDKDEIFEWPTLDSTDIKVTGKCYGTITHIGILVDGTVIPCCLDGNGIINLGNIYEKSFKNIIESERFKRMQDGMKNHIMVEELCKKCKYRRKFEKK